MCNIPSVFQTRLRYRKCPWLYEALSLIPLSGYLFGKPFIHHVHRGRDDRFD